MRDTPILGTPYPQKYSQRVLASSTRRQTSIDKNYLHFSSLPSEFEYY